MLTLVLCFKQKTAYEMRISDWSSDVCSSDLRRQHGAHLGARAGVDPGEGREPVLGERDVGGASVARRAPPRQQALLLEALEYAAQIAAVEAELAGQFLGAGGLVVGQLVEHPRLGQRKGALQQRSEEHTSELQSLMRNSYAVFCLKKKRNNNSTTQQ